MSEAEKIQETTNNEGSEENMAELLEKSNTKPKKYSQGQKIKGKIARISEEWVFVDLGGGKSEGVIARSELEDEQSQVKVAEGDDIEAQFLYLQDGEIVLTTKVGGQAKANKKQLEDAFRGHIPVEGYVMGEIKGGLEVKVSGVRAFCPSSHIELRRGANLAKYLGKRMMFHILEYKEGGRNIILTRREILEEEQGKKIASLKETLQVGQEITGAVRSIQNFGAFVDLGGLDGLIPVSEMSWGRIENPSEVLKVGQRVQAKVTSIDWDKQRISLTLKHTQADPWLTVSQRYQEGAWLQGTVVRLTEFGAFVELEPGVDGLVHISNLNAEQHVKHPKEVVEIGQKVDVRVLKVDEQGRRISLTMEPERINPFKKEDLGFKEGDVLEGTVESVKPYGVFVKLPSGLTGLVPNEEMGTSKGTKHAQMFKAGTPMNVVVLGIDRENEKIRLSRKSALETVEKQNVQEYVPSNGKKGKEEPPLGSLGVILKAKLEEKWGKKL
ncbi:MAG: 30S ribosomal protein S1 [bacterium]